MVKATEVIGRKVMGREGGEDIGKVKDLVVDPTGKQIIGFVVSEGLIHGAKVAPWSALQAIGPDAVILNSADSVVKASEAPEIRVVLDRDLHIRGLRLQSTEGKELGKIEDFRFDEQTGVVEGYELAGGLFSQNSFLPTPPSIELGKHIAFVGPEAEATIQKS